MFQSGTRLHQRGAVLFGVAGGMLVVAGGFLAAYFVLGTHSEASAATIPASQEPAHAAVATPGDAPPALTAYLQREVELVTAHGSVKLPWSQLGAAVDPDELAAPLGDLAALAAKGSLPIRV